MLLQGSTSHQDMQIKVYVKASNKHQQELKPL